MIVFITGGVKNGKSSLAQDIALDLAKGEVHYYVATMIPSDEEDHHRIRRHVADRAGMGFETIECGRHICHAPRDPRGTYLLDSITALLMNELFPEEKNYEMDATAPERCAEELKQFCAGVKNAVVVSDYIYSDADRYDETTEVYRRGLAKLDRTVAELCDVLLEVVGGNLIVHKGVWPL